MNWALWGGDEPKGGVIAEAVQVPSSQRVLNSHALQETVVRVGLRVRSRSFPCCFSRGAITNQDMPTPVLGRQQVFLSVQRSDLPAADNFQDLDSGRKREKLAVRKAPLL